MWLYPPCSRSVRLIFVLVELIWFRIPVKLIYVTLSLSGSISIWSSSRRLDSDWVGWFRMDMVWLSVTSIAGGE